MTDYLIPEINNDTKIKRGYEETFSNKKAILDDIIEKEEKEKKEQIKAFNDNIVVRDFNTNDNVVFNKDDLKFTFPPTKKTSHLHEHKTELKNNHDLYHSLDDKYSITEYIRTLFNYKHNGDCNQIEQSHKISIVFFLYSVYYKDKQSFTIHYETLKLLDLTESDYKIKHNIDETLGEVLYAIINFFYNYTRNIENMCNMLKTIQINETIFNDIVYTLLLEYGKPLTINKFRYNEIQILHRKQEQEEKEKQEELNKQIQETLEKEKQEQEKLERKLIHSRKILQYIISHLNIDTLSLEQLDTCIDVLINIQETK